MRTVDALLINDIRLYRCEKKKNGPSLKNLALSYIKQHFFLIFYFCKDQQDDVGLGEILTCNKDHQITKKYGRHINKTLQI